MKRISSPSSLSLLAAVAVAVAGCGQGNVGGDPSFATGVPEPAAFGMPTSCLWIVLLPAEKTR